jgi:UDPglucose--hexose-1-phosphate uridylyltransferase
MFAAKERFTFSIKGFEGVKASYLYWPLSVIRIQSKDKDQVLACALKILNDWRGYSDEKSFILAETDGVPHNTISPICHKIGDEFAFDLALRNNITTEEYPLGVYHPHQEYWNIKKENIGLIEVMGLAILPSRLKTELALLKEAILEGKDIASIPEIEKHKDWVASFLPQYEVNKDNIEHILEEEVGKTFTKVLECAGVYKQDEEGIEGVKRFISYLNR